ncbi:MAG: hypothetical protein ACO1QR_17415 [Chthoniobacteraceae bacterium]
MSRSQVHELVLFIACVFAFAYFNQGGGWNQNARFAEVRAIVEEGRFAIDNYLIYRRDPESNDLVRIPVENAEYTLDGKRYRLSWVDMVWNLYPVGDHPLEEGVEKAPMVELCASGDIGYVPATGHFHPNKPPGTSFMAVPAYFVIYHVERMLGINPDQWWILNLNVWLCTVCSVGLFSGIGCVLFYRLALALAGGQQFPATMATLAFAFGTTFFPFGTIFFDHNLTAALLIGAFYCLWRVKSRASTRNAATLQFIAGICAGYAAVTNYVAAVAGVFLGLYLLLALVPGRHNWRGALWFTLGVLGPFLLICWYGWVCFGSPFKINNDFQNPLFADPHDSALFGMFKLPSGEVATLLALSPFRGIFFLAPVLLAGVYGLYFWMREKTHVPEARLCAALFAFFFLVNASFNGYHAGFSAGPRYIIPGIPFLALPLVVAFAQAPRITSALAALSIAINLLLTATDAQNPVGIGGHARVEDQRSMWGYNLVGDYALPLFVSGRAWPLLEGQLEMKMMEESARIAAETEDPEQEAADEQALREDLKDSIHRGEPSPFLLSTIRGPVSVNPVGVYEGLFTFSFFPPSSVQSRMNSFNLGELLWPASFWVSSRWSLIPLLLVTGSLSAWLIRNSRRRVDA